MSKLFSEPIALSRLVLDKTNPRHPAQGSQREVLAWMTTGRGKVGDKLLALAKDIAQHGLSPAENIMVVGDPDKDGEYIVLEGNRRVAAMKLLHNPSLAPTDEWAERFRTLHLGQILQIGEIPCTIFKQAEDAYHFIEIKHHGESGGAGVVPWDSEQKARHQMRVQEQTRHHKALLLLDYVKVESQDPEAKRLAGEGFPITTLDRLLTDPDFRDFLGLCLGDQGQLEFRIDRTEAMKPINRVICDFGSGQKNVRDVINKEKREEYRNTFRPEDRADHAKILGKSLSIDAKTLAELPDATHKKVRARFLDPKNRRTVVIPGMSMPIDAKRYNRARRVFEELRHLPIKDKKGDSQYANAAVLLIRLFIEMSIDTYIAQKDLKHPSPSGWREISLIARAKAVLRDLTGSPGRLQKNVITMMNKALTDSKKLANPDSMNDYAHNRAQVVAPADLLIIWDTYSEFLLALWDGLR